MGGRVWLSAAKILLNSDNQRRVPAKISWLSQCPGDITLTLSVFSQSAWSAGRECGQVFVRERKIVIDIGTVSEKIMTRSSRKAIGLREESD
jgi:hypothetical protein